MRHGSQAITRTTVFSVACCILFTSGLFGQTTVDWRKELKAALEQRYPEAKLSWDRKNIKAPGTALLVMQPNVLAEIQPQPNTIVDGVLQPPGKTGFMTDLLRQTQDNDATRDRVSLPRYQPVYLTGVRVFRDSVVLEIATSRQFIQESVDRAAIARFVEGTSVKGDTLSKVDASVRQAALSFEFPKGSLENMSVDQVVATIEKMLVRADDEKAPKFGTVSLGMTQEQVITNLGKPKNIVDLGSKQILVYQNLKVTLNDGKVTDVQ